MTEPDRYPFDMLAANMGLSEHRAAFLLGVSGTTQQEYRARGLTDRVAERLAVKAGFHPFEVWPDMIDRREAELAERRRAQKRASAARIRATPEGAERNRTSRRAYYAENADYERSRERRRYAANRDLILETKRASRRAASSTSTYEGAVTA